MHCGGWVAAEYNAIEARRMAERMGWPLPPAAPGGTLDGEARP